MERTHKPSTAARVLCTVLLALEFWSPCQARAERFTPSQFREWFLSSGAPRMSEPERERARKVQYVFISGMYGESTPGYFQENLRHLETLGVPKGSVHWIRTKSDEDDEANEKRIAAKLEKIAGDSGERLVVIGHSRGARIAAAIAVDYENLFDHSIHDIFLANPAVGRNRLVDYLVTGTPRPKESPGATLVDRAFFPIVRWQHLRQNRSVEKGRASLTSASTLSFWKDHWPSAEREAALRKKVHVIRAEASPKQLAFEARVAHRYLSLFEGPNDGAVSLESQGFLSWARPLLKISEGHSALFVGDPATEPEKLVLAQSLTGAVFAAAGQSDRDSPDEPESIVSPGETLALQQGQCPVDFSRIAISRAASTHRPR